VDDILKEKLGTIYINIPGFDAVFFRDMANLETLFKFVFKKYKEGSNLLYYKESWWGRIAQRRKVGRRLKLDCIDEQVVCEIHKGL
jgi:hypothetical protein